MGEEPGGPQGWAPARTALGGVPWCVVEDPECGMWPSTTPTSNRRYSVHASCPLQLPVSRRSDGPDLELFLCLPLCLRPVVPSVWVVLTLASLKRGVQDPLKNVTSKCYLGQARSL